MSSVPFQCVLASIVIAGAWVSTTRAQDRPLEVAPAPKLAEPQEDDFNKQVEDALKQLEKLAPQPNQGPAPRIGGNGGLGGIGTIRIVINGKLIVPRGQQPLGPGQPPGPPPAPTFGITMQRPSATLAKRLELPADQGILVARVQPDSLAEKSGFQAGDVILEFDGKPVPPNVPQFRQVLQDTKGGKPTTAVVLRQGQKETLKNVVLPVANDQPPRPGAQPEVQPRDNAARPNVVPPPPVLQKKAAAPVLF